MARKGKSEKVPPASALWELGYALEHALRNPSLDDEGILGFRATLIDRNEPISRGGLRCARSTRGVYSLHDLAELAALVRSLAKDLGGGPAKPAPRRRR